MTPDERRRRSLEEIRERMLARRESREMEYRQIETARDLLRSGLDGTVNLKSAVHEAMARLNDVLGSWGR